MPMLLQLLLYITQAEEPTQPTRLSTWLGIAGQPLTAEIAKEIGLSEEQTGVLVKLPFLSCVMANPKS